MGRKSRFLMVRKFILEEVVSQILSFPIKRQAGNTAVSPMMPKKINTEIQYMRKLSNTPLQVNITLLRVDDHISKNTPQSHMDNFYKEFEDIKDHRFDGMIVTGAALDQTEFKDVTYWEKLESCCCSKSFLRN